MIKIQKDDFSIDKELNIIKKKYPSIGAISTFVGYVRNFNNQKKVSYINLDVYGDMAHKVIEDICLKAKKKWNIVDALIIHRFGKLRVNEKIVLVATFSIHRNDSAKACKFIMNYLKKDAPFWKKEFYNNQYKWLKNTNLKN